MTGSVQDFKQALLEAVHIDNCKEETQQSLVIPCLNQWELHTKGQTLSIIGRIKFHERYPDGCIIKTSPILSHLKIQTRLIVMTRNSIYELGTLSSAQAIQERMGTNTLNPHYYTPLPDPWDCNGQDDQDLTALHA